jgi:hypothetical protein
MGAERQCKALEGRKKNPMIEEAMVSASVPPPHSRTGEPRRGWPPEATRAKHWLRANYLPQGTRLQTTEWVEWTNKNAGSTEEEGCMPTT